MHPAIIIGTVRSLWTWLWGRYHVPQNVFLILRHFDVDSQCIVVKGSLQLTDVCDARLLKCGRADSHSWRILQYLGAYAETPVFENLEDDINIAVVL